MPAPRFGETDEEVQNEAQKSILRVFHALILSDFFGASALAQAIFVKVPEDLVLCGLFNGSIDNTLMPL